METVQMSDVLRAADLIDTHRVRIVAEVLPLLDEHVPKLRAIDVDDRARTAQTICVALPHFMRGIPVDVLLDVLTALAKKRLEEGLTSLDLMLIPTVYGAAVRRGLAEVADEKAVRAVEDALLRLEVVWYRTVLERFADVPVFERAR